jgi:hypothetical protein
MLEVEVTSLFCVESMVVRWRMANLTKEQRRQSPLTSSAQDGSLKQWSMTGGGVMVPRNATIVFDLVYYVGGRKFTDDNQGQWYIADRKTKLESVPA